MWTTIRSVAAAVGVCCGSLPAAAAVVQVEITGMVEYNQIGSGPLGEVDPGDPATLTFTLDSDDFVNSTRFPTRGYVIDPSSFALVIGPAAVGLQSPFPGGETPFFTIRNDDPAVDGFFVATSTDFPTGVPIDETGIVEQFSCHFSVTYGGDTLDSLDILGAVGSYDFTGLTVFSFTVNDGPFEPMGMIFEQLDISLVTECTADIDGSGKVDVDDLVGVIVDWGCVGEVLPCDGDVNGDGLTNVDDLVEVVLQWGPCTEP